MMSPVQAKKPDTATGKTCMYQASCEPGRVEGCLLQVQCIGFESVFFYLPPAPN